MLFSLSDDSLQLSTWSSYPPFPSSAGINATMIVGRPPLRPPSLHWTMAPDGFGRPACWRLVCGVAPPLPHLRHRHPTTATATSWSETQLETHHYPPIVGLESPIGLFVQGGQVTILLTIDFYLPWFHSHINAKFHIS